MAYRYRYGLGRRQQPKFTRDIDRNRHDSNIFQVAGSTAESACVASAKAAAEGMRQSHDTMHKCAEKRSQEARPCLHGRVRASYVRMGRYQVRAGATALRQNIPITPAVSTPECSAM